MGTEQDDPHAARRAEMERQFHSLPAAGTPDYWRRIEQATAETALPLEVLARCVRERAQAGASEQAKRIFAVILGCIQTSVQKHVAATARASASRQKSEVAEEMAQECYTSLWEELIDPEPTFFRENFSHALKRLLSHVVHACMEREGLWKRRDVTTPARVPVSAQTSLDEPAAPGEPLTLGQTMADMKAEYEYERVDLETDIAALLAALKPDDQKLLYDLFWSNLTQEQVADRIQVTDKTVRNRLKRVLKQLRRDYFGSEEGEGGE